MIRHIVSAILVLLFIILMITLNSFVMKNLVNSAANLAGEASAAAAEGDFKGALRQARELERYWRGKSAYLESVLMHSELDIITTAISELIGAINTGDRDAVIIAGELLVRQFEHLEKLEKLRIGNIL